MQQATLFRIMVQYRTMVGDIRSTAALMIRLYIYSSL